MLSLPRELSQPLSSKLNLLVHFWYSIPFIFFKAFTTTHEYHPYCFLLTFFYLECDVFIEWNCRLIKADILFRSHLNPQHLTPWWAPSSFTINACEMTEWPLPLLQVSEFRYTKKNLCCHDIGAHWTLGKCCCLWMRLCLIFLHLGTVTSEGVTLLTLNKRWRGMTEAQGFSKAKKWVFFTQELKTEFWFMNLLMAFPSRGTSPCTAKLLLGHALCRMWRQP